MGALTECAHMNNNLSLLPPANHYPQGSCWNMQPRHYTKGTYPRFLLSGHHLVSFSSGPGDCKETKHFRGSTQKHRNPYDCFSNSVARRPLVSRPYERSDAKNWRQVRPAALIHLELRRSDVMHQKWSRAEGYINTNPN